MDRRHFIKSLPAIPGLAIFRPTKTQETPVTTTQWTQQASITRVIRWDGLGNSWESDDGKNWTQVSFAPSYKDVEFDIIPSPSD